MYPHIAVTHPGYSTRGLPASQLGSLCQHHHWLEYSTTPFKQDVPMISVMGYRVNLPVPAWRLSTLGESIKVLIALLFMACDLAFAIPLTHEFMHLHTYTHEHVHATQTHVYHIHVYKRPLHIHVDQLQALVMYMYKAT